jgi:hypothetical protein
MKHKIVLSCRNPVVSETALMIFGSLAAIHFLAASLAATSVGPRQIDTAVEAHRFSFEAADDQDYDGQPDNWSRRRGPGFPPYVRAKIDRQVAYHGQQSLMVELNGAQFAYYSPLLAVDHEHAYVLRGRIKSEGLNNDGALVSVSLLDATRKRVQRLLSVAVTGRHEDWATVEIGPFRPGPEVRFLVVGCHIAQGERTDVRGHVWFDDLWLGFVPILELSQGTGLHFLQPQEDIRIQAYALGLAAGVPHRLRLRLEDGEGEELARTDFDLNGDVSTSPKGTQRRPVEWVLPDRPNGFYRVQASLEREGTIVLQKETSFVFMDPAPTAARGEFGWSLGAGPGEIPLSELAEIAARAGVNWLKLPLWSVADTEQKLELSTSHMSLFLDHLEDKKITLVGMLSDPPPQLAGKYANHWVGVSKIFTMPRDFWYPSLEPLIARHSFRIHHWQLGSELDDSFVGLTALAQTLAVVKGEFDHVGHDSRIGFHWKWDQPFPAGDSLAHSFLSLGGTPRLDEAALRENLERTRTSAQARWVLVSPLPRSEKPAAERASELARQMLVAKLGGAEAIFADNPLDPERGLLNPDGSPTEMYLPWRTMALALRGANYVGRFEMPNASPNAVFDRGNEVVVIVWNARPTSEEYFFGDQASLVDLWGRGEKLSIDSRTQAQTVSVGPTPLIIRGCSVPIARWRMGVHYANGRVSSEYGQHEEALLGTNTFPQGITGRVTAHFPPGWEVDPVQWPLHAAAGEQFRLPLLLTFPRNASLGKLRTTVDFEVAADRPYKFSMVLPYELGLGDVDLKVASRRLPDGRLEIEQRIINNTEPLEILEFNCSLFIPGQVRLSQFVTRLGKGEDQRFYFVPNPDSLRGKELLLRAVQVDGRRVLNYHFKVDE